MRATVPRAKFSRIRKLGKADSDTSLLARAIGTKALSYIERFSRPTTDRISARFGKSVASGDGLNAPVGLGRQVSGSANVIQLREKRCDESTDQDPDDRLNEIPHPRTPIVLSDYRAGCPAGIYHAVGVPEVVATAGMTETVRTTNALVPLFWMEPAVPGTTKATSPSIRSSDPPAVTNSGAS